MIVPVPPTVSASPPVRALLAGAIDYAGLFPPANLDLTRALEEYLSIAATDERWALGRFVIPVATLLALTQSLEETDFPKRGSAPIRLAGVMGTNIPEEVGVIEQFNQASEGMAVVDAIEVRAPTPDAARAILSELPPRSTRYLEVPPTAGLPESLDVLREGGAFAKLRTGGVTPEAFPGPEEILDFLEGCARRRVPFKATAGLHHPIRGEYRLTYAPRSLTAAMYGYLNVLAAAALLWTGDSRSAARDVLLESAPSSFRFDAGGLRILGHLISADTLRRTRSEFAHGFGSCSFREPLDELGRLART